MRVKACLFALAVCSVPFSADAQCDYAGQTYTVGATVCECPSLKVGDLGSTGAKGQITSRRLSCTKDQGWLDTHMLCVEASGVHVQDVYPRYVALFCPRVTVTPQETERFFDVASREHSLLAVRAICRRFDTLEQACKTLIEGLGKGN